jgi:chaperonin GroEL
VTVAEDIELDDPYENLGAQLVKEAASKTNEVAGDGTTTATVLAEAIFREGLKMIASGYDPMALSRGLLKATEAVCEEVNKLATPISEKNKKELEQIATIAGNNDPSIGAVLADAFLKVGKDGVITIEEGKGNETTVEVVEGMQFDRGFLSPHFVTNQDEVSVELENAYILLYEEKISSNKKLIPLLEAISKANKPLLIVAEDIEGEALATLVVNKLRGILQVCAVKAPATATAARRHGRHRRRSQGHANLQGSGHQLESVKLTDLGRAKNQVTSEDTIIIGARHEGRNRRPGPANSRRNRPHRQRVRPRSCNGWPSWPAASLRINCGAATETEMKERKWLLEDAQRTPCKRLWRTASFRRRRALIRAERAIDS